MKGILIPTQFEASVLLKGLQDRKRLRLHGLRAWQGKLSDQSVTIALIGMGPVHAAARTRRLLKHVAPEGLILAGFAGGLDPSLELGDIVRAEGLDQRALIHCSPVVIQGAEAKQRLWEQTQCRVVEMELAAVSAAAEGCGLPLTTLRVVSDDSNEALPTCLQYGYDMQKGRESPLRMASYLLSHPGEIAKLKRFLKRTRPCATIVAQAVMKELSTSL